MLKRIEDGQGLPDYAKKHVSGSLSVANLCVSLICLFGKHRLYITLVQRKSLMDTPVDRLDLLLLGAWMLM
jgi:hypothetical protein